MRAFFNYPQFFYEEPTEGGGGGGTGEEKVVVEPTESREAFNKKYAYNRPDLDLPPGLPGLPAEKKDETEVVADDKKTLAAAEEKPLFKKPGSNLEKILEQKRTAEKERDELKGKADKFEKEDKPVLEKKVADLEKLIAEGGHTREEATKLNEKLAAAEAKLAERETSLVNENKELRSRLSFHDVQQDPDFKEQFIRPMTAAYSEAVESFQGDDQKTALLRNALLANGAALNSKTVEERRANEKQRQVILSQISDSLDEFSRGQFQQAMNAYIRATKTHAEALGKHEEVRKQIVQKRDALMAQKRGETFAQWTAQNDVAVKGFEGDEKFEGELADVIKELKLNPSEEVSKEDALVKKIITGQGTIADSVRILQQGRVYPALNAKVKAQDHLIKGLKATIAKLKGTKPGGDPKDGREAAAETKTTKADFNSRFSASRPGLRGRA